MFDIPLFYYHINLRSSAIHCRFLGDIYFFLGISTNFSVSESVSELFCSEFFLFLSATLLPIRTSVASAVFFLNYSF